jgi:hypothetical protein
MNEQELRILNILYEHKGRSKPITVGKLVVLTGISEREVRQIVKNLLEIHHYPVASSVNPPYGYSLITDPKEAEQCLGQYYARAKEVLKRANILNEVVREKFKVEYQRELFTKEELNGFKNKNFQK